MIGLSLDLVAILAVLILTFLFDLVDLHPQIGSFSFLKSFIYYTYYLIRAIFGLLAAVLLQSTGIFPNSILLALGAVVAAVSTLESFNLRIGGEGIVDLRNLFETYRKKMIETELERATKRELAQQMRLVHDLSSKLTRDSLKKHSLICLRALHRSENAVREIDKKIGEIERIGGSDNLLTRTLFAMEIVGINPNYAKQILIKDQSEKVTDNT